MTVSPNTIGGLVDGVKFLVSKGLAYLTADLAMATHVGWKNEQIAILCRDKSKMGFRMNLYG